MSTTTSNYGLRKPADADTFDQQYYDNYNMDAIDNALKINADAINARVVDYVRSPAFGQTTGGTGTPNAYLFSSTPALPALADGACAYLDINIANTGAATLNWDNKGAKPIVNADGTALVSGDLALNGIYGVRYNASTGNFQLLSKGGGPSKVGSNTVFTVSTADQAITKGYYGGALIDGKVKGESQLTAENLPVGVSIGGVNGNKTYIPLVVGAGIVDAFCDGNNAIQGATYSLTYVKVKEIKMLKCKGVVRFGFTLYSNISNKTTYAMVYKNGVQVGTEYIAYGDPLSVTIDIPFNEGDLIQVFGKTPNASWNSSILGITLNVDTAIKNQYYQVTL